MPLDFAGTGVWSLVLIAHFSLVTGIAPSRAGEPPVPFDEAFVGTVLSATDEHGNDHRLRLDDVRPATKGGLLYRLSIMDGDASMPLCVDEHDRPIDAIPLAGTWRADGAWHPGGMTFACRDGVLAKCVRWGYVPWQSRQGRSLRAYHQACTRLVRADYCGDGKGHTRDGTPINIWDDLGVTAWEQVPGMTFEAAWTGDGAFGIQRTRYPEAMDYVRRTCPDRLATPPAEGLSKNRAVPLMFNESFAR